MQIRRPSGAFVASVVAHVIVGTFFAQALLMERPLFDLFGRRPEAVKATERIGFLVLPQAKPGETPTPGQRGGNGRHVSKTPPTPVTAPTKIPTSVPTPPAPSPQNDNTGTGPVVGGGGNLRGIQPRYEDPRVWGTVGPVLTAPKTDAQRLDSVITADIGAHNDSMRVAAGQQRAPGDWTFERGGKKYGIDSKYIRLGPVSIPTAVLAMLPLNVTNNPTVSDRERAYAAMHNDIMWQAQRSLNDADFQKAVRSIRERKERERRAMAHDSTSR